jgi:anthranilate synthase component 1
MLYSSIDHARSIAVSTVRNLARIGRRTVLYPFSINSFLVAITGDHEVLGLADSTTLRENLHRMISRSSGPAREIGAFGVGNTVFALSYDLGECLRGVSGTERAKVLAEISTVESALLVRTGQEPKVDGPEASLLADLADKHGPPPRSLPGCTVVDDGKTAYASVFNQLKDQLKRGNSYQTVLSSEATIRFDETWLEHFDTVFAGRVGRLMPYLYSGAGALFYGNSVVPHLRANKNTAETIVVAGTLPVAEGSTGVEHSGRHRAEHLMLVDLERNDLGAVAEPDGVLTGDVMHAEPWGATSYLTTRVRARTATDRTPTDVLLANLPRSVVTGAPKRRTMEIIRRLENRSRGFYGGVLGLAGHSGRRLHALTILGCVLVDGDTGRIPTGGGVTLASQLKDELAEIDAKRRTLLG